MRNRSVFMLAAMAVWVVGCSSQTGYEKAFSANTALQGNSHRFNAPVEQAFRTAKTTLVQQGFTIEQADEKAGLIKAVRSLQDPQKPKYAYLITTSVDVTGAGADSVLTVAASQQTILHKDSEKYFHLLGLVPIPTGRNYQTVVTKEGNIETASFYNDFFTGVTRNLALFAEKASPASPDTAKATALPSEVPPAPPSAVEPSPASALPAPAVSPAPVSDGAQ